MFASILRDLSHDPAIVIYMMQAITYSLAALASRHAGHAELTGVYAASSVLHAMLGTCRLVGLG
jgi:hypothetical protein